MDVRPISNDLQEKAKSELNEIPERIPEDLKKIREWIQKQPHLNSRTDDQWLLTFLRGCKFSIERTKEKLDSYYTIRTLLPEFFKNRDPLRSDIQEVLNAGILLPLPRTVDDVGPRIILVRTRDNSNPQIPIDNIAKAFFMLLDILMAEDDNFAISGAWIWVDFASFSLSYIFHLTPPTLKKNTICLEKGYPARINSIHFTNSPSAIEQIFNLLTSLASPKLKEKMAIYSESNTKDFYKLLPKEYMPVEYGGENESINDLIKSWKNKFEAYREWFLEDEKYGTNEKLRPVKPTTCADLFGVEGSFRKLTVD